MLRYITSRLGTTVVMALLATLVIFLIANTVPGDPVLAQLGDVAASNKEFVAEWRARYGLDLPMWHRYWIFLTGLLQGDLGQSIASQRPVLDDIREYVPATLELATVSFLLSLAVGIPLGVMAAVKRDTWVDHLARVVSLIGVSSPTFWLAFIVLAIFYGGLEIAPGEILRQRHILAPIRHRAEHIEIAIRIGETGALDAAAMRRPFLADHQIDAPEAEPTCLLRRGADQGFRQCIRERGRPQPGQFQRRAADTGTGAVENDAECAFVTPVDDRRRAAAQMPEEALGIRIRDRMRHAPGYEIVNRRTRGGRWCRHA